MTKTDPVEGRRLRGVRLWTAGILIVAIGSLTALEALRFMAGAHVGAPRSASSATAIAFALANAMTVVTTLGRLTKLRLVLGQLLGVAATICALTANAALASSEVGNDTGPAVSIFGIVFSVTVIALRPRLSLAPVTVLTLIYITGRLTIDDAARLWPTLDETIAVGATCLALGVLVESIRRAAIKGDELGDLRLRADNALAEDQASEEATEELRRIIHDEVLAALALVDLPVTPHHREIIATAARQALAAIHRGHSTVVPLTHHIPGGPIPIQVDLVIAPSVELSRLPAEVVAALTGATAEALRNVHRHSGEDHALVTIQDQPSGGIQVDVVDKGHGFSPELDAGFGISSSIIGRTKEVGGDVAINSDADGTRVTLTWGPSPASRSSNYATLLAAMPALPRVIHWFVGATFAGQFWLAARHGWNDPAPWASVILSLSMLGLVAAVTVTAARRDFRRWEVLLITVVAVAATDLGLRLAGPQALAGYDWWIVGLAECLILATTFSAGTRYAVAATTALTLTIWWAAARDVSVSPLEVIGPILQPTFHVGGLVAALIGVRYISATAAEEERAIAHAAVGEARAEERTEALRENLQRATATVSLFLTELADSRIDPSDTDVRRRARQLATNVRDELFATWLLDMPTRAAVERIRAAGGSVTIRPSTRPHIAATVTRQVLQTISPPPGSHITVTPGEADRASTVVISPATRCGALPEGVEIENDQDATVIRIRDAEH